MRTEYDKESDVMSIYFTYPVKEGQTKQTIEVKDNSIELEFDNEGRLLCLEIRKASKVLDKETLDEAKVA